jgi:hypothetical protein
VIKSSVFVVGKIKEWQRGKSSYTKERLTKVEKDTRRLGLAKQKTVKIVKQLITTGVILKAEPVQKILLLFSTKKNILINRM